MSVRSIALRSGPRRFPVPAVTVGGARPVRTVPRARGRISSRAVTWRQLADDRRMVGLKVVLLVLLALAAMALEVPL